MKLAAGERVAETTLVIANYQRRFVEQLLQRKLTETLDLDSTEDRYTALLREVLALFAEPSR